MWKLLLKLTQISELQAKNIAEAMQQLLDLTEDVDFDGEKYIQRMKEEMENAFDAFTGSMTVLTGVFKCQCSICSNFHAIDCS